MLHKKYYYILILLVFPNCNCTSLKLNFYWDILFKMGHSRPLFLYFRLFNTADSKQCSIKISPMTGFELRTSGVGSDHSTNCATSTSHPFTFFYTIGHSVQVFLCFNAGFQFWFQGIRNKFKFLYSKVSLHTLVQWKFTWGVVSLYGWPLIYLVWIQLLC